jgi:RNA polymerase sigma factor (sigma-70 family)
MMARTRFGPKPVRSIGRIPNAPRVFARSHAPRSLFHLSGPTTRPKVGTVARGKTVMQSNTESRTSASLLARLRLAPADQTAWSAFVDRYGRKIYGWCRHWGLQEADAQDVTQDVLVRLAGKMRDFAYDPSRSFRAWLKTLARHALSDFCDARGRIGATGGSQALELLQSVEAREELVRRLEEEFDQEVLEEAIARVRTRVTPKSWRAFELTAHEGRSGAEAAEALGMTIAAVFVAKGRVQKLLQEEVRRLEGPG